MLRLPSRPFWRRALSRFALAYLLFAQLLLGAAATAQHAGLALAAEGGLLCAGGAASGADGAPAHAALCCVLGCAASAPVPVLDADGDGFAAPLSRIIAAGFAAPGAEAPFARPVRAFEATGPPARA